MIRSMKKNRGNVKNLTVEDVEEYKEPEKEETIITDYDGFDDAVEDGFIDNLPPYSYGPSCPDRLLSYHANRHILLQMLKDFDAICRREGIRTSCHGMFVAALVAAWYEEIRRQSAVMKAQTIRVPFAMLVNRAGMLCGSTESDPEEVAKNKAFRKEVSEALEFVLREMDHVVRVEIPEPKVDYENGYEDCRMWALEHKNTALRWFETPQEVYGRCEPDVVLHIDSTSDEEEYSDEFEDTDDVWDELEEYEDEWDD